MLSSHCVYDEYHVMQRNTPWGPERTDKTNIIHNMWLTLIAVSWFLSTEAMPCANTCFSNRSLSSTMPFSVRDTNWYILARSEWQVTNHYSNTITNYTKETNAMTGRSSTPTYIIHYGIILKYSVHWSQGAWTT